MPSVAIDDSRILVVEIQGAAHSPAAQQGQRGILLIEERIAGRRHGGLAQQVAPAMQAIGVKPLGKARLSSRDSGRFGSRRSCHGS